MARPFLLAATILLWAAGAALAAGASVTVEVGKTITTEVGFAKGLNCDNLTVADVQIRTKSPETNELVITGLKPGRTTCRVGMPSSGPSVLVSIHVVEKVE